MPLRKAHLPLKVNMAGVIPANFCIQHHPLPVPGSSGLVRGEARFADILHRSLWSCSRVNPCTDALMQQRLSSSASSIPRWCSTHAKTADNLKKSGPLSLGSARASRLRYIPIRL